jgi:hypothetical protein
MQRLEPASAYIVRDRNSLDKILAVEAELLRSEGVDPAWPGFPGDPPDHDDGDV